MNNAEYETGLEYRRRGFNIERNPYEIFSEEWKLFRNGFYDADLDNYRRII